MKRGVTFTLKCFTQPMDLENNMTDPNIGRRWNSPYGVQIISERLQYGSGDLYTVLTEGTGVERRYRADSIDEVIKRISKAIARTNAAPPKSGWT